MRRGHVYISSGLITICLLFFLMVDYAHALGMREYYLGRRYIVGGGITLSYGMVETDDAEPEETFTQRYSLGLTGYAVHPRLITFSLSTAYTKEDGTTRDGWHLFNSIQLNILPYKPLNLSLRYSRTDSDTGNDYNAYGLTLTYQRPVGYGPGGMRRAGRRMNNNGNGLLKQILPIITVLDLDRIEYTDSKTTLLALRLKGRYKSTGYNMASSYSKQEREEGEDIDRTAISLDTYTDIDERHELNLGGDYEVKKSEDRTSSLFLYGNLSGRNKKNDLFYGISTEMQRYTERQETYSLSASAGRVHAFPGNLTLNYSAGAFYRSTDGDDFGLSGNVNASKPLSNVVSASAGAGITVGDTGSFNLSTRLYERPSRRFNFTQYYRLNYRYGSELSEDDKGVSHRLGASANMHLHRRLLTSADVNYYTKHGLQTIGGSISASTWFWRLGLGSGVGASTTSSDGEEYQNYEAYINLRGNIMRGLYLSVDTRYTYQSHDDLRRTIIRPYLYWNWRRLSARLEYEYVTEERRLKDPTTTQRVFVTITRSFGRIFYR